MTRFNSTESLGNRQSPIRITRQFEPDPQRQALALRKLLAVRSKPEAPNESRGG